MGIRTWLGLIAFGVWAHFALFIFWPIGSEMRLYLDNIDGNVASNVGKLAGVKETLDTKTDQINSRLSSIADAIQRCVR